MTQRGEAEGTIADTTTIDFLTYVFLLLALLSFLGGFYIYRRLPLSFIKRVVQGATDESDVSVAERINEQIAAASLTYSILVAAFLESCGIYGLILVILGADFLLIFPFILLSLAGFIIFRPIRFFFERVTQKVQDVSGSHTMVSGIESRGNRANRMKLLAFMFVVLWVLLHILLEAVVLDFSTVDGGSSIMNTLITCIPVLFVGLVALWYQRVGGIILIIFGAFYLVAGGILLFARDASLWVILLIEAALSLPLLLAGILFLESHRRKGKTGEMVAI
jgi:hypothetical protein